MPLTACFELPIIMGYPLSSTELNFTIFRFFFL